MTLTELQYALHVVFNSVSLIFYPGQEITTAGTELMWLIDPKQTNQKETQYSYPHKIEDIGVSPWASNKISFCWVWSVLDPL